MKVLIVFSHPSLQSFNGALRNAAIDEMKQQGHEVMTSDLYQMHFDPVLTFSDKEKTESTDTGSILINNNDNADMIKNEQEKVTAADVIMMQTPMWYFGLPAMLKGWLDRVLAEGFAYKLLPDGRYDLLHIFSEGCMKNKRVLLSMTTGGPEAWYTSRGVRGDIRVVLWPITQLLAESGFTVLRPSIIFGMDAMTLTKGAEKIQQYRMRLRGLEDEKPLYLPDIRQVTETSGDTSQVTETSGDTRQVTETSGDTSQVTETSGDTRQVTETSGDISQVTETSGDMAVTVGHHMGRPIPDGWFF